MNKALITEELLKCIWACENAMQIQNDLYLKENREQLEKNLQKVEKSSSGSWLGYHANVYYDNFKAPPPGARFSQEWGFMQAYSNETRGEWREYSREDIEKAIFRSVDIEYFQRLIEVSRKAKQVFEEYDEPVRIIIESLLKENLDEALRRTNKELADIERNFTAGTYINHIIPTGQVVTRDYSSTGFKRVVPAHVAMTAKQIELRYPFIMLETLKTCSKKVLKYMEINDLIERKTMPEGKKIFIGHGGSKIWKDLKDFLRDRLHFQHEEFNRESVAGIATKERLEEMLNNSCFAFLIMTAEDEHTDNTLHARENVIHEVGLFQGRLGFRRAIILLEDGCKEFSNIHGLGEIRFPKDNISVKFEEIRQVLEREGIIKSE